MGEKILIFDIGSGSVGGAVVEISKNSSPFILQESRRSIRFMDSIHATALASGVLCALRDVAHDLERSAGRVDQIMCVYASPWYFSETAQLEIGKEKGFKITGDIFNELMGENNNVFRSSGLSRHSDGRIIESEIIDVKLNGYSVDSPFGKTAKKVSATLYMSIVPSELAGAVEETIGRIFHTDSVTHHSYTLAAFTVLRDVYQDVSDFLLFDISGEVTDISLIREGAISHMATFPKGKNFLLRELSGALNTSPEESLSILKLYGSRARDEYAKRKAEDAIERARAIWTAELGDLLIPMSAGGALPNDAFLSSDNDVGETFGKFLSHEEIPGMVHIKGQISPYMINGSAFRPFCNSKNGVLKDPFLAMESVFASKIKGLKG